MSDPYAIELDILTWSTISIPMMRLICVSGVQTLDTTGAALSYRSRDGGSAMCFAVW